jgi:hypothetical protein
MVLDLVMNRMKVGGSRQPIDLLHGWQHQIPTESYRPHRHPISSNDWLDCQYSQVRARIDSYQVSILPSNHHIFRSTFLTSKIALDMHWFWLMDYPWNKESPEVQSLVTNQLTAFKHVSEHINNPSHPFFLLVRWCAMFKLTPIGWFEQIQLYLSQRWNQNVVLDDVSWRSRRYHDRRWIYCLGTGRIKWWKSAEFRDIESSMSVVQNLTKGKNYQRPPWQGKAMQGNLDHRRQRLERMLSLVWFGLNNLIDVG